MTWYNNQTQTISVLQCFHPKQRWSCPDGSASNLPPHWAQHPQTVYGRHEWTTFVKTPIRKTWIQACGLSLFHFPTSRRHRLCLWCGHFGGACGRSGLNYCLSTKQTSEQTNSTDRHYPSTFRAGWERGLQQSRDLASRYANIVSKEKQVSSRLCHGHSPCQP